MFEYLLFDWDGCLADTLPIWYQGMKRGLLYFGIEATDTEIKKGFQTWEFFVDMGVTDLDLFTEAVYRHVTGCLDDVRFNEGVFDLLEQTNRRGIKAAIVTNTEQSKVRPVLSRLGAEQYFECIIGREEVAKLKPDPEPVCMAMDKIGGQKEKTVMIGDSLSDVLSGKNAGIATVWYTPENNIEYHLNRQDVEDTSPDIVISHMKELETLM